MTLPLTRKAEAEAKLAAEAVPIEDAITTYRAITGQYHELVMEFGAMFVDRLVDYAHNDMRAALQGSDQQDRRQGLERQLEDKKLLADAAKKFSKVPLVQETGYINIISLTGAEAQVTDSQELIDDWDLPIHNCERARVPLHWLLPVRRAVDLQAKFAWREDDRVSAADLQQRINATPHVQEIAASLAASAATEVALVQ